MKIQLMSDTHLESYPRCMVQELADERFSVNPEADILVLAGDITSHPAMDHVLHTNWFKSIPTVWVLGNHEYYDGDVRSTYPRYLQFLRDNDVTNCKLVGNTTTVIDTGSAVLICATLWTACANPLLQTLTSRHADFQYIKGMSIEWMQSQHLQAVHDIKDMLKFYHDTFPQKKRVVVTHQLPTYKQTPPQYKHHLTTDFFNTELSEEMMFEDWSPHVWMCGHSHQFFDDTIGNTRIVNNGVGYGGWLNSDYKPQFIVDI